MSRSERVLGEIVQLRENIVRQEKFGESIRTEEEFGERIGRTDGDKELG